MAATATEDFSQSIQVPSSTHQGYPVRSNPSLRHSSYDRTHMLQIGGRNCPYKICCPWVHGGWDLDALGKFFRRRRRRRRRRRPPGVGGEGEFEGACPPKILRAVWGGEALPICHKSWVVRPDRGSFDCPSDNYTFNHISDNYQFDHISDNYHFNRFSDNYLFTHSTGWNPLN